ncbi:hypothetical protein SAMN05216188_13079 [Lentzea xinjiangensis]|uniref:Uncharacterized protein n=1 Tax=Lentzea xinjiangensis TaxID=402600 RepID=A0A1H9W4I0_9PSEU|nr:hypothetical protein [Lentzea xinjiangensis]SES28860.1 hypothetical protein SAMN05216188_13079 [Lentzea xinjiangensis]
METATNAQCALEKTVQDLREQLDHNTRTLAFLPPGSVTYDRLVDRVEHQTAQLLAYEDRLDRQRRAAERAALQRHRRQQQNETLLGGGLFIAIGAVITYTGWGTWWLVLAVLFIAAGLLALVADDV